MRLAISSCVWPLGRSFARSTSDESVMVYRNWQREFLRLLAWRKSPSSRAFFDYPRERLPDNFHYTGPWHSVDFGDNLDFPWEKLDGRP